MGQIVFNGQKPKYCNLSAITIGSKKDYVIPAGEVWLIDSTNASKVDGTGKYDYYIIGDDSKTASQLAVDKIRIDDNDVIDISGKQDIITTVNVNVDDNTGTPSGTASVSGNTFTLNLSNLKGAKGDTGAQGIQGVQGERGPQGNTGVQVDSVASIIHSIDSSATYAADDVAGADAVQYVQQELNDKWVISPRTVNYVEGHYYNDTGAVKNSGYYGYTEEYIPILPNTAYSFNPGATCNAYIIQYTSEKEFKTRLQLNAAPKNFTSAADAYYLRVSFLLAQIENVWLKDDFGNIIWQPVTPANIADAATFNSRITPLEEELEESEVEARVLKTYTPNYYIMANSENADFGNALYHSNAEYACTPFINISGYNKFSVATLRSSNAAGAGTVIYDENKLPIVGYYKNLSSGSGVYTAAGTLPENAAYIRVSDWSSHFNAGSVVLHLWDTLKEFTIRKTAELDNRITSLESSGGIPPGLTQYEYIGEKISLIPKFAISTYMSLSLTGTGQGGAVFGDYYFIGTGNNAYINVFNLSTKAKLAAIVPDSTPNSRTHDNTMCFSNQYYNESDQFPILYISSGYPDGQGNAQAYGYRITNTNDTWAATLVHTITLASAGSWSEFLIDNIRQKAWIASVGNWYCVDMPQYVGGDAEIDISSLTPEFHYPPLSGSGQGHLFYNDKIYFCSGIPDSENVSRLYVLNTKTGKYDSEINLLPILGVSHEPENVFVYNGHLFVASRHNAFRIYFE